MNFNHQLNSFVNQHRNDIIRVKNMHRAQNGVQQLNIESLTNNNTVKNYLQSKPELLSKVRSLAQSAHSNGKISESQLEQINSYLA